MLADIAPWQVGIAFAAVFSVVAWIIAVLAFRERPRPKGT